MSLLPVFGAGWAEGLCQAGARGAPGSTPMVGSAPDSLSDSPISFLSSTSPQIQSSQLFGVGTARSKQGC